MNKSSAATANKTAAPLPTRSAWSKGPPPVPSATGSPRSQSPAPSPSTPLPHQTHSRRPSALGQGVPIKDGVSINRNTVPAAQQGPAVTFGSIDDTSATISSSPATVPALKSDSVKSFGSLPAAPGQANGKAAVSISRAASTSSTTAASSTPSAPPKKLAKADIAKLFQTSSSSPANTTTPPLSDTSSPSVRPSTLPSSQSHSPASSQPPSTPSQLGHSFTPFVPQNGMRNSQQGAGPGAGPRSPGFARQQMPNGNGPRPPPGPTGQMSSGLSSPRLPMAQPNMPPQPNQPHTPQMAPPPPQMWTQPQYFYDPNGYAYPTHPGWYAPPHMQPHQMMPGQPHPMPMSPRNPQAQIHPGTPTQSHAVPLPHAPQIAHTPSGSISSPPPTPSSAAPRLNTGAPTFVPGRTSKISFKNPEGKELNLDDLKKAPASPAVSGNTPLPSTAGSASPNRRSQIRIEAPSDKAKRLAEEQEKERKVKEEKDRKAKEDEERQAKEKEAAERKEREAAERKKMEEDDAKEKERLRLEEEEKEKQRKVEEELKERLRKEEEERKQKEAEENAKAEEARVKEEAERKKKEADEKAKEDAVTAERQKAESDAAAKDSTAEAAVKDEGEVAEKEDGEITEPPAAQEKVKFPLRIDTQKPLSKFRPGPLDLTGAKANMSPAPPSALATARIIEDINKMSYPEGISSPKVELNANTFGGKFRYDRDFLLQFMKVCKERPDSLPALDAIGLEPSDQNFSMSRSGSQRGGGRGGPSRTPSISMSGASGFKPGSGFPMGNFGVGKSSEERFANASTRAVSGSAAMGPAFGGRPSPMQRTASQTGGSPMGKTRSKRGNQRDVNKNAPPLGSQLGPNAGLGLEPVAPLQQSENRWDRKSLQSTSGDSPELVDRKVKSLLNKLTMEKFDSISEQIIDWANKSEKEKDGRTLIQVIRLVFEKATDEAAWSEMYARLCRKMMETISPRVQDDGIKNAEGKPIAGGQLFRKYLLNRCQEDFERGWVQKEATAAAAASKAKEDEATKKPTTGEDEVVLYSEEYYTAQKAKRQGLGLIKFIGELFKLQMLTERIMHECVKKLLGNVENPEEEEIESLCKLLATVGSSLDTVKARAHMDVYFSRMRELTKSPNVTSRMQFMLQDVIELRDRKWQTRNAVAAPTTIAQIHEAAAKEKAQAERESYQRTISMSRGGSKRGGDRSNEQGADGWTVSGNAAPRPPPKAGDLSKFGKLTQSNTPMTFGPASVFSSKKDKAIKETLSRSASSSNMFSMLNSDAADAPPPSKGSSRPPSRKSSIDFGSTGGPGERRKLALLPRSKPVEQAETAAQESSEEDEEGEQPQDEAPSMSADEAKKKVKEDIKEFYGVRNIGEAENYFQSLPSQYHAMLVDNLVSSALESKDADAKLVADFFAVARSKDLCSLDAFEKGFSDVAEFLDDVAIDAPKAPQLLATMLKGVSFDSEAASRIAAKSAENGSHLLS